MEETEDSWLLALEAVLPECSDDEEIINITRGRTLPEEHRAQIWRLCLGGATKVCTFSSFDGIFDLQEQSLIRNECKALVDKLGNDDEDKLTITCNIESIFTHYCKTRNIKFCTSNCWSELLLPLLAVRMPADSAAFCFQEIVEKYIPRENGLGAPVYHLLRLLLLYHDPELSTFLDSRKITPDLYAMNWVKSVFAAVCDLEAVVAVWDVYLTEKDPFFILFLSLVILVNAREQILAMSGDTKTHIVETLTCVPASLRVHDVQDFCTLARFYIARTPATFRKEQIFGSIYLGKNKIKIKKKKKNRHRQPPSPPGRSKQTQEEEEEERTPNQPQEEEEEFSPQEEEEEEEEVNMLELPISQSLCLYVSPEEVVETAHSLSLSLPDDSFEQVRFFLVDCRPANQYNSGHLPNAFHLDATLMLHHPSQFSTAVQGLLLCQKCAVASGIAGEHLCFIGAGREEEDRNLLMVISFFLQRCTRLVCVARGGYAALHDLLVHDLSSLAEHNSKECLVCVPPLPPQQTIDQSQRTTDTTHTTTTTATTATGLSNKFSSLSTVFKSRSYEMREKLLDYITNPSGPEMTTITSTTTTTTATTTSTTAGARHVSSQDKGKLYRQGDVFSIEDEDEDSYEEQGRGREREGEKECENMEKIDLKELLKRKEVVTYFPCQQVKENGYLLRSVLVLTGEKLMVVREIGTGRLAAKRNLASIIKITSKKRHPDLITFKYGLADADADEAHLIVADMDRFIIPNASRATKTIKEQILKQMTLQQQQQQQQPHS